MKKAFILYISFVLLSSCSSEIVENKENTDSIVSIDFDSRYFRSGKPTTFIAQNLIDDTLYFICKPTLFNENTHANYRLEHMDTLRSVKNKGWTDQGWSSSVEFDTVILPPQQNFPFASGFYAWAFDSIKVSYLYFRKTVSNAYIPYTKSEYFVFDTIKHTHFKSEPFKVPKEMGRFKNPDTK
ncbi:MAG: hypothetical protein K0S33_1138 [Bacteroidetes bacterium]|jgi:hypothetical protein|nr:hypothetical protein [Bacteroidota bacterium]